MKKYISTLWALALLAASGGTTYGQIAPYVELGAAGPQNWAVLDQGNFSISDPTGYVTGNIGDVRGNVSTGGSAGVTGSVYLGSAASYSGPAPSGGTVINSSLPGLDLASANTAALYYDSLNLHANFTSAPSAGTVAAGVYNITGGWSPSGGTYNLTAGQVYVFNISGGNFAPSGAFTLHDSTPWDVIINVSGNGNVQSSGGGGTWPTLDAILLTQGGNIQLTPGQVNGEIIAAGPNSQINIASRGAVNGVTPVPEPRTFIAGALLLLPLAASVFRSRKSA
ncbi:MAG TPA: hypothetical protein VGR14_10605 [Verrucomicrobiae bacterium]|jgi:hypothetical protein|nr:hypothetical protein [Verrucomicrobiae bacterium]